MWIETRSYAICHETNLHNKIGCFSPLFSIRKILNGTNLISCKTHEWVGNWFGTIRLNVFLSFSLFYNLFPFPCLQPPPAATNRTWIMLIHTLINHTTSLLQDLISLVQIFWYHQTQSVVVPCFSHLSLSSYEPQWTIALYLQPCPKPHPLSVIITIKLCTMGDGEYIPVVTIYQL